VVTRILTAGKRGPGFSADGKVSAAAVIGIAKENIMSQKNEISRLIQLESGRACRATSE